MPKKALQVEFGGDYRTDQIYSLGYEFAFMSEEDGVLKQACPFVYCKDFLHDAIWAFLNKTKVSIWSFNYDVEKNRPLEIKRTVLAFRNTQFKGKDKKFHEAMENCLEFLHGIERMLGFRPTRIEAVEHPEGPTWVVIGDKRWQHAPTMISLYTLLIRLGCFHKLGDDVIKTLDRAESGKIKIGDSGSYAGNKDCSYVKQARKGIDAILRHGIDIFHEKQVENYPPELKGNGLHDNYGIVNFTLGKPKKVLPHWYREGIWE